VLESPRVRRAAGHADTPLAPEALREKFLGCTRHAGLDDEQALGLYGQLQTLDRLEHVEALRLPGPGAFNAD